MKHLIYRLTLLLIGLVTCSAGMAQSNTDFVDFADRELVQKAVTLMDNEKTQDALEILDKLHQKYPDNYTIAYERCYAMYLSGNYKLVLQEGTKLLNHADTEPQCFQMIGNALDNIGRTEQAMRTYDEGLKRFPNSGFLFLEKGNVHLSHNRFKDALICYLTGVDVQPEFASNYYRLAYLLAQKTNEWFWAGMNAEVVCNMQWNTKRQHEMSQLLYDIYSQGIELTDSSFTVTLTQNTKPIRDNDSTIFVPLELIYKIGVENYLTENRAKLTPNKDFTVTQLSDIRRHALMVVDLSLPGHYRVSLLDYQRELINADLWQAYNMTLFSDFRSETDKQWCESETGKAQLEKFYRWQAEHPFLPTVENPTLMTKQSLREALNIPSDTEITTAEGCRTHQADALRLAKWYLQQPFEPKDQTLGAVIHFLFRWMEATDDYSFGIISSPALKKTEILMAYIAAMVEHGIEFNVKQTDEAMYCEVMLQVLEYYKRNKIVIGDVDELDRYLTLNGASLREALATQFKKETKQ